MSEQIEQAITKIMNERGLNRKGALQYYNRQQKKMAATASAPAPETVTNPEPLSPVTLEAVDAAIDAAQAEVEPAPVTAPAPTDENLLAKYDAARAAMKPGKDACKHGHQITFENANKADLKRAGVYCCDPCIKAYAANRTKKAADAKAAAAPTA